MGYFDWKRLGKAIPEYLPYTYIKHEKAFDFTTYMMRKFDITFIKSNNSESRLPGIEKN